MRNFTLKFIAGSFCFLAVVPPGVQAQTKKESRTIVINNGDTVVNGKKLSELDRSERKKVQEDFDNMRDRLKESRLEIDGTGIIIERNSGEGKGDIIIRRTPQRMVWSNGDTSNMRFRLDGKGGDFKVFSSKGDSLFASLNSDSLRFRIFKPNGIDKDIRIFRREGDTLFLNDSAMVKRFRFDIESRIPTMHPGPDRIEIPNAFNRSHRPAIIDGSPDVYLRGRNNSQSFSYSNTDKNGISTRMNIRVSEPAEDDLKAIAGTGKPTPLAVEDLTLFPNFSSGKMTLSFNIASKGTTQVRVLDSDKKIVFTDTSANFSGNYVKQISIPNNGIYYISVRQDGKWFVKRVVKD